MTDARRAGRVAFGWTLIAGAALLVASALRDTGHGWFGFHDVHAAAILGITWLAAFVAAGITYLTYRGEVTLTTSLVVPACGMALVTPLTIHLLFTLLVKHDTSGFDEWAGLSLIATGIAHVVFAAMAMTRAYQLAKGEPALSLAAIYFTCVGCGAIPFVVPIIYVAFTGLPILPLLAYMERLAERERAIPELPRATIRLAH
jgi:hypothetical protein